MRSISSQSSNGFASISVRRQGGEDLQDVLDRVRLRVDGIPDLPDRTRRPVIETSAFDSPALYVNLHGASDPATLQTLAQRLKEELLSQPELSRLKIWGLIPRNLRIEIDPERLRHFSLTIADVTDAVRANSLDFQAGRLRTEGGTIFLRADDRALYAPDYAGLPIIERPGGASVSLGDIATIEDGFLEGEYLFRLNGEPTIGMEVLVGQKENLLEISRVVRGVVEDFEPQLPTNITATVWGDSAEYIADRLALLRSNGFQGLLLVTLLLSIFLTTATTVIGLMPLLTETSEQAQYLIPAAVSLALGELFGTALMLILVPVLLAVGEDLFALFKVAPAPVVAVDA